MGASDDIGFKAAKANDLLFNAVESALATIVFDLQGHVVRVNDNFAHVMEYEPSELIGLHHQTFCSEDFASSPSYVAFWDDLRQGKTFQDKIQRVTKTGQTLTLQATYMPIVDETDKLIGVIKVATDITERESIVRNSTAELMAMVEEMTAGTDEILAKSQVVANEMEALYQTSKSVNDSIKNIGSIASFVEGIASQSNLLGLNAAIEAARSGEHGRGFSVVATEIRNMAEQSKQSATEIKEQLESISKSIQSINLQSTEVANKMNDNLHSISELKRAYDYIAVTTENLSAKL